jgi:hypothetical protein
MRHLLYTCAAFVLATLQPPETGNWCKVGHVVMVPDGREGPVTSLEGDICRVLVYGEKYVSLWQYSEIEPIYPQKLERYNFGH